MECKFYKKHNEQFKNMKNFEKINTIGYYSCILLALALFLSIQFQRILGIWVSLLFLITMIFPFYSSVSSIPFLKTNSKISFDRSSSIPKSIIFLRTD